MSQTDLNNLISQLPSPFIILGDLNGHSPFWGSADSNSRGLQIEQLLADHNLCLLNSDQKTHFHLPTRTFHSVDLAISSPSRLPFLNLTIDNDLYNSDHFPLIVTDNRHNPSNSYRPPKYILNAANWEKFTSLSNINSETIKSSSIEQAPSYIVNTIIEAADNSIPKILEKRRKQSKPWWNADCKQAYKKQRKAWNIFRRYPTTENFINFKKTRAESRRIQRRSRRASWRKFISSITSTISSRHLWTKVKRASGVFNSNAISVIIHNGQTISSLKGIADSIASTLSRTSSSQNYPQQVLNHKINTEKQKLNFNSRTNFSYNSSFSFLEFQSCLASVHDSSLGPDSITYSMIKHLTTESQNALLHFYNRIWQEQYFPTLWQQAIIIPLLKPGKDPKNPSNYRPIALTCCLCKLLERMINRRLVYYLEANKYLHPFQSGFRKGRSTIDNLLALETDIRLSFLQRKHLVAIFFDIEKAYDRTWSLSQHGQIYGSCATKPNSKDRGEVAVLSPGDSSSRWTTRPTAVVCLPSWCLLVVFNLKPRSLSAKTRVVLLLKAKGTSLHWALIGLPSYTPSEICPISIDPVLKLSSTDTRNETVSFQFKFPEINKTPPDFSDFKTVTNRKKLKKDSRVNQDNITVNKVSPHYKPPQLTDKEHNEASNSVKQDNIMVTKNGTKSAQICSVGLVPDSMAAFPPKTTKILELDADAEMSSSSASEGDTLEYDMSEDLEDTPQNICPTTLPPPSTARKR
ncbi:putative RNA-directed DNA polymerase from transposon X-element [Araneus ventricosus]|uniref:Putative RNA-directed DNA polymerase from transposon X-element n=1 Tax=Araneus ventricosus TaxID=182803 RepID=A0A4Y2RGE0_ARAVE|nr:putative RNA-directed DNA polymerase from transposon X-element [Araneus ventricosus]